MALTSYPRSRLFNFIRKRSGPFDDGVMLDSSRVYILPSRTGLMFCMLLLLLLVGSINYEKSLGYALTFLLVGIGHAAMLSTWKNLKGLHVDAAGCAPVFAGDSARFRIRLSEHDGITRRSIGLQHGELVQDIADVAADGSASLGFSVDTVERGRIAAGPCKLFTEYPFGLFVAWTWVDLNMHCLVYPAPSQHAVKPVVSGDTGDEGEHDGDGLEMFDGLRNYQQGDSYKRVSWKAFARNRELMIKQYSGGEPEQRWIDWDSLQVTDIEQRLASMCRLLLDAEEQGRAYGLRLPGKQIEVDRGHAHRNRCLRALALYGKADDEE